MKTIEISQKLRKQLEKELKLEHLLLLEEEKLQEMYIKMVEKIHLEQ